MRYACPGFTKRPLQKYSKMSQSLSRTQLQRLRDSRKGFDADPFRHFTPVQPHRCSTPPRRQCQIDAEDRELAQDSDLTLRKAPNTSALARLAWRLNSGSASHAVRSDHSGLADILAHPRCDRRTGPDRAGPWLCRRCWQQQVAVTAPALRPCLWRVHCLRRPTLRRFPEAGTLCRQRGVWSLTRRGA